MKKQGIVCFGFWLSLVAIAVVRAAPAEAGGFALPAQNPMQIGRALAGGTVATSDATVVFHNPAGMTALPGEEALGSVSVIYHRVRTLQPGVVGNHAGQRRRARSGVRPERQCGDCDPGPDVVLRPAGG